MSATVTIAKLKSYLADLAMPGSLEVVDSLMEKLDQGSMSPAEAMERLISAQVSLKRERRLSIALNSSKLPSVKKLAGTFQRKDCTMTRIKTSRLSMSTNFSQTIHRAVDSLTRLGTSVHSKIIRTREQTRRRIISWKKTSS